MARVADRVWRRAAWPSAGTIGLGIAAGAVLLGERWRPLRGASGDGIGYGGRRLGRNLVLGAMSMAVVGTVERPLSEAVARRAERDRRGMVQRLALPAWARDAVAVVLMDYGMYGWHVLTHKVPALWRLHLVHHVDLDLDGSTALRFHAADMLVSVPVRALQVAAVGASPRALRIWRRWFFLSVLFHHGNLRLPERWERRLGWLVTTPRMHGIHHSTVKGETDSNWSSGISVWDRIHGTFRDDVEQEEIAVGVPGYRDPDGIGVVDSLRLPFGTWRDAWRPQPGTRVPVEPRTGSRGERGRMKPVNRA